jgi:hypothetical protein
MNPTTGAQEIIYAHTNNTKGNLGSCATNTNTTNDVTVTNKLRQSQFCYYSYVTFPDGTTTGNSSTITGGQGTILRDDGTNGVAGTRAQLLLMYEESMYTLPTNP